MGSSSEETPIEIMTLFVVLLTSLAVFTIFWSLRSNNDHILISIWFLTFILFIIFLWRELDFYFPAPLQTNILGFFFLILITYFIWHHNKFSAKLCILGIIALVIAQGCDNLLDFHILPQITRYLKLHIIEESLELFSALFFLQAFINLIITKTYMAEGQIFLKGRLRKEVSSQLNLNKPIH